MQLSTCAPDGHGTRIRGREGARSGVPKDMDDVGGSKNLEALVDHLLLNDLARRQVQPVLGLTGAFFLIDADPIPAYDDPAHLPILSENVAVAFSQDEAGAFHINGIHHVERD